MNVVGNLLRWRPGNKSIKEKEAELAEAKHALEETLERNRRNQVQIIRSIENDKRRSQQAFHTAAEALYVARRAGKPR